MHDFQQTRDVMRTKPDPVHDFPRRRPRFWGRLIRSLVSFVGLVLLLYWGGAFLLTHVSIKAEASVVRGWHIPDADKFVHMAIYTGLAFLLSVWFGIRRRVAGALWVALTALLLLGIYAAFDEITQGAVHRDPDLRDWFADMAGINLGLFGFFCLRRYLRQE